MPIKFFLTLLRSSILLNFFRQSEHFSISVFDEVVVLACNEIPADRFDRLILHMDSYFRDGDAVAVVIAHRGVDSQLAVKKYLDVVIRTCPTKSVTTWVADRDDGFDLMAIHLLGFGNHFWPAGLATCQVVVLSGICFGISMHVIDAAMTSHFLPSNHDPRKVGLGFIANKLGRIVGVGRLSGEYAKKSKKKKKSKGGEKEKRWGEEGDEDDEATKEPVDSNDASKAEKDGNQSDPLNSSNSNIEEEFECIKLQLQEFSNMNIAVFEKQRKQEAKEAKMRERNSS